MISQRFIEQEAWDSEILTDLKKNCQDNNKNVIIIISDFSEK